MHRTSFGLTENLAGLLCYSAGWLSGVCFLVLEADNDFVRFHAMQSAIVFSILTAATIVFGQIPVVGHYLGLALLALSLGLWLVLTITTYRGERLRLPWVGGLSDRLTR